MRGLVTSLEHKLRTLNLWCMSREQSSRYYELVTQTLDLATATIDLYEQDPFPERDAIGQMYRACEAGLALLDFLPELPTAGPAEQLMAWTMRDVRMLISELFEYVVPISTRGAAQALE